MIFIDLLNPSLSQTHLFGSQNIEIFLKISKICMNFVEKHCLSILLSQIAVPLTDLRWLQTTLFETVDQLPLILQFKAKSEGSEQLVWSRSRYFSRCSAKHLVMFCILTICENVLCYSFSLSRKTFRLLRSDTPRYHHTIAPV